MIRDNIIPSLDNKIGGRTIWSRTNLTALAAVLSFQFFVAYYIGKYEILANTQFALMPPIAVMVLIPVALFLFAYVFSARFKSFVLAQDIHFLTALQLWRVIGFSFLMLYAAGTLPALFALPAGLGDFAVGITAAYVIFRMGNEPGYVISRGFMWFQFFGMLDFFIALSAAALSSGTLPSLIENGLTSSALDVWPLNLFPGFIVPGFIILHLIVILKVRHLRGQATHGANSSLALG